MGKILITGPGRAGTTFLVQLLTRLGFDTGYEPYREPYLDEIRAGCEQEITGKFEPPYTALKQTVADAPYVLKSPEWSMVLKEFLRVGIFEVDHCYIPLRDLDIAARSRLDAGLDWQVIGPDAPYEERVRDQGSVHALALGRAVEACFLYEVPFTLMRFPRLVEDAAYCWDKLSEGLEIGRKEFDVVFSELAKPEQVKW